LGTGTYLYGCFTVSKGPPDIDFNSPKKEVEKSVVNKFPF
jgi:hypothetical protein